MRFHRTLCNASFAFRRTRKSIHHTRKPRKSPTSVSSSNYFTTANIKERNLFYYKLGYLYFKMQICLSSEYIFPESHMIAIIIITSYT